GLGGLCRGAGERARAPTVALGSTALRCQALTFQLQRCACRTKGEEASVREIGMFAIHATYTLRHWRGLCIATRLFGPRAMIQHGCGKPRPRSFSNGLVEIIVVRRPVSVACELGGGGPGGGRCGRDPSGAPRRSRLTGRPRHA